MKLSDYITEDNIIFHLKAETKDEVLCEMSNLFINEGTVLKEDHDEFIKELKERENTVPTGLQDGIAIPHVKSNIVKKLSMAFGRDDNGIEFNSLDGRITRMFFMLAIPESSSNDYLVILSLIAGLVSDKEKREKLYNCESKEELIKMLDGYVDNNGESLDRALNNCSL